MDWKSLIVKKIPFAASLKREFVALRDSCRPLSSYSQCGEDRHILEFLNSEKIDIMQWGFYIEIGANQPSQSSNSFLFYQLGASGILVEPDIRCCNLLRRYRSRDIIVNALAGAESGVGWLFLQRYTTLNSSSPESAKTAIAKRLLPRLSLDDLWRTAQSGFDVRGYCFLLSIDTEGGEEEILKGAGNVIENSYFICLEHHGWAERKENYWKLLGPSFEIFHESPLNVIFRQKKRFLDFLKTNNCD